MKTDFSFTYLIKATQDLRSCDFETDFCDFVQRTDDGVDWSIRRGSTPSGNTGPTIDHTTGTSFGKYSKYS